jgi:TrmH family RNA methyltransferase
MITSKQNALIKEIRSLSDKKFRDRLNLFVVEGIKPVNEAIALKLPVRTVIYTEKATSSLVLGNVHAEMVSDEVFKSVSEESTPQGALAIVEKPDQKIEPPLTKCLLLDGVSDPSNVGAIIRTAAASGYNFVYLTSDCADCYSQKAVRSSMSGVFRVKIMRGDRAKLLEEISLPLVVADMDGEDVFAKKPLGEICLVIGNEGHGVSSAVR